MFFMIHPSIQNILLDHQLLNYKVMKQSPNLGQSFHASILLNPGEGIRETLFILPLQKKKIFFVDNDLMSSQIDCSMCFYCSFL